MGFTLTFRVLGFITYSCIMAVFIQLAIWTFDRSPPFKVITSQITPPSYPGGTLLVEGEVYRDMSRECSFVATHWIEDHKGFRHYLPSVSMNTEAIKRANDTSPNYTKYAVPIPDNIQPGKSVYDVIQAYSCNPVHQMWWPILIETRIPFTIKQTSEDK